jgi:hypothetical protein
VFMLLENKYKYKQLQFMLKKEKCQNNEGCALNLKEYRKTVYHML